MRDARKHLQLNESKWDKWAPSYDSQGWLYNRLRKIQSGVVSLLELSEGINFLDVGCGTGWAVGETAKRVNHQGSFYGVDLSPKMIEKAESNLRGMDQFHFIQSDAESIPLEGDFFDVIICTNSFHHYLNPDKVLNEFYRLLKRGGRAYIHESISDRWFVRIADVIARLMEPEHVKFYSAKEMKLLLREAGFKYSDLQMDAVNDKMYVGEK